MQKNLRETILQNATVLFSSQGYSASTVKQIADKSGCKAASLYYFFEGGKSEILHEVVHRLFGDVAKQLNQVKAENLDEFLISLGIHFETEVPVWLERTQWLYLEYHHLSEEDREFVSAQDDLVYQAILQQVRKFVLEEKSEQLTWLVMCSYLGFGHYTYLRSFPVMGGDIRHFSQTLLDVILEWTKNNAQNSN